MGINRLKENLDTYISLSLAMVIVGSSVVVGKLLIMKIPVFLASGLRFTIACVIIWPIILIKEKGIPKVIKRDWLIFLIMAFCGQFMFTVLMLIGLKYTQAMEAGIIISTTPAVMASVSFLILKERSDVRQFAGIALATLGVLIVNGLLQPHSGESDMYRNSILGNLLICGAVMGETFFLLLAKKITSSVSDLCTTGILSLLGVLMFLPFSIYEGIYFDFEIVLMDDWLYMLYFGAVYTVVAYIFWFRGVKKVNGSTASAFTALIPMSATILSVVCLNEKFTLLHAMGFILITGSITLMSCTKLKEGLLAQEN